MRPTEKKIENLLQNLNENTRPELDEKILDNCFTELNTQKSSTPVKGTNIWSIIMKNPITKYAAVLLVSAGFLSVFLFSNFTPQAIAFEEVIGAMKNITWLHQTSKGFQGGVAGTAEQWLGFDAKIHAAKWADGKKTFWDINKQKRYEYDPEKKYITLADTTGTELPFDITSPTMMVESIHKMLVQQGADVAIKSVVYKEKKVQLQRFLLDVNEQKQCLKLFIDPKSKLLIGAEVTATDENGKTLMDGQITFSYPKTGPTDIYDLDVPKDTPIEAESPSGLNGVASKIRQIDQLETWPEPIELVKKYWDARNERNYETTRLYWPNSEQWDERTFEKETPVEYVLGTPKRISDVDLYVHYDTKYYYEQNQKYRFKMMLSNIHSNKGRYYIVSGN